MAPIIGLARGIVPVPTYVPLTFDHAVLADNTVNGATTNYDGTTFAYSGADIFDTDSFHDTVTNNSRLVIPSSLNGRYVVVYATIYQEDFTGGVGSYCFTITKNGSADYVGMGAWGQLTALSTFAFTSLHTAPVLVAAGDYFEVLCNTNDATTTQEATFSGFGLLVVG